ncbi:hypothetical protein [Pseudonocardia sp. TRM90224]|uniref:hypothetical protein n=1 Tax=Pseudonocardia sp. TRM90224 TaxID=2812678 RepID=UPI001E609A23|nr:hypothetical protein [Pseudonocardia sp. TRM90224]
MDMTLWFLLAVLVAIALAAPRYGVDSRWPGRGEPTPPPRRGPTLRGDLAMVFGAARHALTGRSAHQ